MDQPIENEEAMKAFGERLGRLLGGGEVVELVGDVGAGKTTFVKGLARGLDITEEVQSPTFTINRMYDGRDGLHLAHYDFYRLSEPGIMQNELIESIGDENTITVIEWAAIVDGALPADRLTIRFRASSETTRLLEISGNREIIGQL